MPSFPRGNDIASVKFRLRAGGWLVRHLWTYETLAGHRGEADDYSFILSKKLSALGYSKMDYERDKYLLEKYYVAEAEKVGSQILKRMQYIVEDFERDYIGQGASGPQRLTELGQAVSLWLPFVSLSRFVPLTDTGNVLTPLKNIPGMQEMQKLPLLPGGSALKEPAPPPLSRLEVHNILNTKFRPWRGLEDSLNADDPRLEALKASPYATDRSLRNDVYTEHPILLMFHVVTNPTAVELLLQQPAADRSNGLQDCATKVVAILDETVVQFKYEIQRGDEVDWNRLEPVLLCAEAFFLEDEPEGSFLRTLLPEIREKLKPWTPADVIAAACVVAAVVITVASMGAGSSALLVLASLDLATNVVALVSEIYLADSEGAIRENLNSFKHLDQALVVAAPGENTGLTLLLGVLTLAAGTAVLASLARSAKKAKGPANEVGSLGPATGTSERQTSKSVSARTDEKTLLPASTTIQAGPVPPLDPAPIILPSAKQAHATPGEIDKFAEEMKEFHEVISRSRRLGITEELADDLALFQDAFDESAQRLVQKILTFPEDGAKIAEVGTNAGKAIDDMGSLQSFRDAMEEGLAMLYARDLRAWEELARAARSQGGEAGERALQAFNTATVRGQARLRGSDPEIAVEHNSRAARMRRSVEERSKLGNIESSRDPRSRYDPTERATHDTSKLTGTKISGSTTEVSIGGRGTIRSTADPDGPSFIEVDAEFSDFDLQTAGTYGIERIAIQKSREEGSRIAVTIEGLVQPWRIPRRNYNRSSKLLGNKDLGLPVGEYELSHAWGAGFGDEAAPGIFNAPRVVNQILQNRYIENWIRRTARTIYHEGGYVRLKVEATTWAPDQLPLQQRGGDFLRRVSYEAEIGLPNRPPARVRISLETNRPPASTVDSFEFDDSAVRALSESDIDAYRAYLFTDETDEFREAMARSAVKPDFGPQTYDDESLYHQVPAKEIRIR